MKDAATRRKVSLKLRQMNHKPSVRGGNGKGMTKPQSLLLAALSSGWVPEFSLSLGKKTPGFPTCYKMDLANPAMKIAIEVDGASHRSRKDQDQKKDAKLASLGWTVLRLWNKDILSWSSSETLMETSISTTLGLHGIRLSPSTAH
jgi:hypothetical protein